MNIKGGYEEPGRGHGMSRQGSQRGLLQQGELRVLVVAMEKKNSPSCESAEEGGGARESECCRSLQNWKQTVLSGAAVKPQWLAADSPRQWRPELL